MYMCLSESKSESESESESVDVPESQSIWLRNLVILAHESSQSSPLV